MLLFHEDHIIKLLRLDGKNLTLFKTPDFGALLWGPKAILGCISVLAWPWRPLRLLLLQRICIYQWPKKLRQSSFCTTVQVQKLICPNWVDLLGEEPGPPSMPVITNWFLLVVHLDLHVYIHVHLVQESALLNRSHSALDSIVSVLLDLLLDNIFSQFATESFLILELCLVMRLYSISNHSWNMLLKAWTLRCLPRHNSTWLINSVVTSLPAIAHWVLSATTSLLSRSLRVPRLVGPIVNCVQFLVVRMWSWSRLFRWPSSCAWVE